MGFCIDIFFDRLDDCVRSIDGRAQGIDGRRCGRRHARRFGSAMREEGGASAGESPSQEQKCVLEGEVAHLPVQLSQLDGPQGLLSLSDWTERLDEDERKTLRAHLPDGIDERPGGFLEKVLRGEENVFFGAPIQKLWWQLVHGELDEEVVGLREGLHFLKKKEYYHTLRDYHDRFVRKLEVLKEQFGRQASQKTMRRPAPKVGSTAPESAKGGATDVQPKASERNATEQGNGNSGVESAPKKRKRGENVLPSKKGSRVLRSINEAIAQLSAEGVDTTESNIAQHITTKAPLAVTATIVDVMGVVSEALKFLQSPPDMKEWLGKQPILIVQHTDNKWVWVGPPWGETITDDAGKPSATTKKLEPALEASFAKAMRGKGFIIKPDDSAVANLAKLKSSDQNAGEQHTQNAHSESQAFNAQPSLVMSEGTYDKSVPGEDNGKLLQMAVEREEGSGPLDLNVKGHVSDMKIEKG